MAKQTIHTFHSFWAVIVNRGNNINFLLIAPFCLLLFPFFLVFLCPTYKIKINSWGKWIYNFRHYITYQNKKLKSTRKCNLLRFDSCTSIRISVPIKFLDLLNFRMRIVHYSIWHHWLKKQRCWEWTLVYLNFIKEVYTRCQNREKQ